MSMTQPPVAYLYFLPTELWLACLAFCSLRQLRRISLVCVLFRSYTLPLVFQYHRLDLCALERTLKGTNWIHHLRHLQRSAIRLEKLHHAPYAPLISSWHVVLGGFCQNEVSGIPIIDHYYQTKSRVITTFRRTLRAYHNLSSLCLHNVDIDAAFRQSLRSLSKLEDLQLANCTFMVACTEGFLPLRHCKIRLDPENTQEPLQIASPDTLRGLHMDDHWIFRLIKGFGQRVLGNLVDLSIRIHSNYDMLFAFLKQCPQLECLVLNAANIPLILPLVHPHMIPRLRSLTAPSRLQQLLTPNRPVNSATVSQDRHSDLGVDHLIHTCVDISRSSAPVCSLVLPPVNPTLESMVAIMSLFPELRELSMEVLGMTPSTRYHRLCGLCLPELEGLPVDHLLLDLSDDTAFTDLPAEEISDDEADASPTITVVRRSETQHWITDTDKCRVCALFLSISPYYC